MEQLSVRRMAPIGAIGQLDDEAAATVDSNFYVVSDFWCAEIVSNRNYFEDVGDFALQLLQDGNDKVITRMVKNIALLGFRHTGGHD